MKINEQRRETHRIAIRTIALLGVPLLLYVVGGCIFQLLPKLGLPPCQSGDDITQALGNAQAILIIAGIWFQIRVFRYPTYLILFVTLLVSSANWPVYTINNDHDERLQKECTSRSLGEAMRACDANPKYYRVRKDENGYDILTLIAPGNTDQSWKCMFRRANYNSKVSMNVDESVYREYRRVHSKRD